MISIIIPVYNGEKYIMRCLNSCVNQTYNNIEIIVVDDGSLDQTCSIVSILAAKDTRIRLIKHHINKGVVEARKKGIKESVGDFVFFLDADDFIPLNAIEILYKKIIFFNADMVRGNFATAYDNGDFVTEKNSFESFDTTKVYKGIEFIPIFFKTFPSLCSTLYKKNIVEIIIHPGSRICVGEDLLSVYSLLRQNVLVAIEKEIVYYYYCNLESVMKSKQIIQNASYYSRNNLYLAVSLYNLIDNNIKSNKSAFVSTAVFIVNLLMVSVPDKNIRYKYRLEIRSILIDIFLFNLPVQTYFICESYKTYILFLFKTVLAFFKIKI